uniref:Patatin n=1 Tax=Lobosphaera incisa TaxID=312850 RepID=A0A1X9QDS7_9CHLO|nr:lipid body protein [Lobosphaera incisa]
MSVRQPLPAAAPRKLPQSVRPVAHAHDASAAVVVSQNRDDPPTITYPDQPVPYLKVERKTKLKTILSVDGGGIRGLIPAVALEYLEYSIKQEIVANRASIKVAAESELKTIPDDPNRFYILLADYFDVMAGTSTGSILATYMAAKGADYDVYSDPGQEVKDFFAALPTLNNAAGQPAQHWRSKFTPASLRRGTAASAQCIFLAKANFIFPKPNFAQPDFLSSALPSDAVVDAQLAKIQESVMPPAGWNPVKAAWNLFLRQVLGDKWTKKSVLALLDRFITPAQREAIASNVWGVFQPKYTAHGIEDTLGRILGTRRLSTPGALHTSLVVQSFELDYNRPFTFFYDKTDSQHGYATLARALSKDEQEEMDVTDKPQEGDLKWLPDFKFIAGVDVALAQVVRSSTAAPTFLPAATVDLTYTPKPTTGEKPEDKTVQRQLCDGGVCANNPTIIAMAFTLAAHPAAKLKMSQTATLSLGTGSSVSSTRLDNPNAGALQWVLQGGRLVDILSSSPGDIQSALGEFFLFQEIGMPLVQFLRLQTTYININADGQAQSAAHENEEKLASGRWPSEVLKHMDQSDLTWDLLEIGERAVRADWSVMRTYVVQNLFPPDVSAKPATAAA